MLVAVAFNAIHFCLDKPVMATNPYLTHLPDQSSLKRKIQYSNGTNGSGNGTGSAIDGFLPRKINVAQCTKAMVRIRTPSTGNL